MKKIGISCKHILKRYGIDRGLKKCLRITFSSQENIRAFVDNRGSLK